MTQKNVVAEADALSVALPSVGLADVTTSTADEYFDLSPFIGKYVTVSVEDQVHFIAACEATGTPTISLAAATTPTKYVGFPVAPGQPMNFVVSRDFPRLIYRTATSTGKIRVHRT